MRPKRILILLVGVIATLLGILWFLQGTGILRLCPVLCFADCECVTGGSTFWLVAGGITFVIGAVMASMGARKIRSP